MRPIRVGGPAIVRGVQQIDFVDFDTGKLGRLGEVELRAGVDDLEKWLVLQGRQFNAIGLRVVKDLRQRDQFGYVVPGLGGQAERPVVGGLTGVAVTANVSPPAL